jgi:hypothetical protein
MRISFGTRVYTLEEFHVAVQGFDRDFFTIINSITFNVNPYLLNIYNGFSDNNIEFTQDFTRVLYKELTPLYYQVWWYFGVHLSKVNERTMSVPYILGDRSLRSEIKLDFNDRNSYDDRVRTALESGDVLSIKINSILSVFAGTLEHWNKYIYPLLKIINRTLIRFLLSKSELYSSLDALSKTMDYRGIFIDEDLEERLKKKGRYEEFVSNELSKDALLKVFQLMYMNFLAESGLTISPETKRAIPGDLPLDLMERINREMQHGLN